MECRCLVSTARLPLGVAEVPALVRPLVRKGRILAAPDGRRFVEAVVALVLARVPDAAVHGVGAVCLVFLVANLLDMLCRTKVKPLKLRELEQMREGDAEGGAAKLAPGYSERTVPTAGTYEPPLPRRIVTQLKMGTHGGS